MLGPSACNLTHFRNFGELLKHNFWGEEYGEGARGGGGREELKEEEEEGGVKSVIVTVITI